MSFQLAIDRYINQCWSVHSKILTIKKMNKIKNRIREKIYETNDVPKIFIKKKHWGINCIFKYMYIFGDSPNTPFCYLDAQQHMVDNITSICEQK
jgi:hypothetical protein